MPPVSLSPIKEFHLDLANTLHRATTLVVKLKQAEESAKTLYTLEFLTNKKGGLGLGSELDEDSELTASDASAITRERDDIFRDIQQFRAELEEILDCLQGHYETPLESFLSADEDESVQHYGKNLISWFQGIRGQLIEISGRTKVILEEKEERKKKLREESDLVLESLDQLAAFKTYAMRIESKLNDVAQRQKSTFSGHRKLEPKLPDVMNVDDPPASLPKDFTIRLENTKTNLREFLASQPSYTAKADFLRNQTSKAFYNLPPRHAHPIIPVRNVEIDVIELDPTIQRIVVEEFKLIYGQFFTSLTEETGKREEEAISNLTKTMAEGNKLACKLLATNLD